MVVLGINFPAITSTTLEDLYIPVPMKGTWRIVDAWWAVDTTQAAGDGSNNANVTLATQTANGGSYTVRSTLSGNGTAFTAGTQREFTFTEAVEVQEGQSIRISKTITGTGGTIAGYAGVCLEKVQ